MRRRDGAGQRAGQEEHASSDFDYYYYLAYLLFRSTQAYPDMLMIGVQGQCPDEGKTGKLGCMCGKIMAAKLSKYEDAGYSETDAASKAWSYVTNYHFKVLVVDLHPLQSVYLLNFIH